MNYFLTSNMHLHPRSSFKIQTPGETKRTYSSKLKNKKKSDRHCAAEISSLRCVQISSDPSKPKMGVLICLSLFS